MASRCRRYRPRRLQALKDNPELLVIRPSPPSASLNDLQPFNLSTVLMAVHKHCYTSLKRTQQGGPRRRETTTNPIESTFATVRHRTIRSKGCLSNRTALAMVFKLLEAAQKSWRRLDGHNQLPKLVLGVTFNNGIEVIAKPADRQPTTAAA